MANARMSTSGSPDGAIASGVDSRRLRSVARRRSVRSGRADGGTDGTGALSGGQLLAHPPHSRQLNAGLQTSATPEAGPAGGSVVILLHGWPYDIHSYAEVAPLLASAGYRVIVPYLRGFGTTRFLADATPRNGQQSVIAVDIIALMDSLRSRRQPSPAMIGAHAPPTSSRRSGRSAARPWFRSAAI